MKGEILTSKTEVLDSQRLQDAFLPGTGTTVETANTKALEMGAQKMRTNVSHVLQKGEMGFWPREYSSSGERHPGTDPLPPLGAYTGPGYPSPRTDGGWEQVKNSHYYGVNPRQ
ncbi:hypothetical protein HZA38_03370 [Candidatus Peregrinibacteria bacterium]|nr:hypothetical protein [Candidatus Peregrinibacteria bacterium]